MKKYLFSLPILIGLMLCAVAALSQPTSPPAIRDTASVSQKLPEKPVTTDHQITVAGKPLAYRATAGFMPLTDEAAKVKANFFFVAYEKQGLTADQARRRPVTFLFNGGPGAASVWLHLGTVGPLRLRMGDELGSAPAPPFQLVENNETWLDMTDLVFIDPVGTGYSRAAAGEKPESFYGVKEDVASVAEFIRLYLTRYQRWPSPKFLAGESYGTTRAAALSEYLLDRYGIALNGMALISSILNFQTISPDGGNDLPYALYLPSYTASAWYHQRLSPELRQDLDHTLREVERFALGDYLTALAKGTMLPVEERHSLAEKLGRYTGLPATSYEKNDLRLDPLQFAKLLLEDRRLLIGRFDARLTGLDPQPGNCIPDYDPSLSGFLAAYGSTFNNYIRSELHFESDLPYEVLSDRVRPWNFGNGSGYLDVAENLRSAMVKLPALKIFIASGYFDLAVPYLSADYTVNHLGVGGLLQRNIEQKYYPAGHMLYHRAESRRKLKEDIKAFMSKAMGK